MINYQSTVGQTEKADSTMLAILAAHVPVVGGLVPLGYGTFGFAFIASALVVVVAFFAYALCRGTRTCGVIYGVLLMTMSAIMIQAQLGRIEMHFHIFSALAVLILYRDALVIVAAAGAIAVHHVVFTKLEMMGVSAFGMPIAIYDTEGTWTRMLVHAAFVVFEAGILVYFATTMMSERGRSNAQIEVVQEFKADQRLDRRLVHTDSASVAFNEMLSSFEELVRALKQSTDSLSSESEELAAVSGHNRSLLDQQNNETQQAVSATEEMATTIQEVTQNAQSASDSARKASEAASNGDALITRLVDRTTAAKDFLTRSVESMSDLSTQIEAIGTHIESINDLSEQTNLLALNAAIEAARAGDAGRGFTVVADEVRSLSRRTQDLTHQIEDAMASVRKTSKKTQDDIGQSQTIYADAEDTLNETRASIATILSAVEDLQSMNIQTASASEEQSAASQEIRDGIHRLAENNEEVLRGATTTDRISARLADLAGEAERLVHRYTVKS